jgi:lysophospholipase L1-like esterase
VLGRLALVAAGVCLAIGLGELGLRLSSPTLPSLAGLEGLDPRDRSEVQRWTDPVPQPADCRAAPGTRRVAHRPKRDRYGEGPRERLWVVGDSVVQGWGVAPGAAWPQLLAQQRAATLGRQVDLLRLGSPGLGHCGWIADLHHALDGATPDRVVMQLFGDDLERRELVLVNGQVVAWPRHALAQRSFLANRLWFAWASRRAGATPERDTDAAGQARFRRALRGITARLDTAGVPWQLVLVPPAGIERCTEAAAWSDCDWLRADMALIAELLDAEGIPYVDLRSLWAELDPGTLPDEEHAWTERGRLPVHPGPPGHAAIAERLAEAGLSP